MRHQEGLDPLDEPDNIVIIIIGKYDAAVYYVILS